MEFLIAVQLQGERAPWQNGPGKAVPHLWLLEGKRGIIPFVPSAKLLSDLFNARRDFTVPTGEIP